MVKREGCLSCAEARAGAAVAPGEIRSLLRYLRHDSDCGFLKGRGGCSCGLYRLIGLPEGLPGRVE